MKIILATSNKGKIKEIKDILEYEVEPYFNLIDKIEIEETGATFKENAIIKAKTIYEKVGGIVLADDSGISVEALDNAPGIYSARYAGENATDKDNLNKLIKELKERNIETSNAFYTASIAIATNYGIFTTHGFLRGKVITEKRGDNGFGYDPIFIPNGFDKTLGELDNNIKKQISHRKKALELAKVILNVIA